MKKIFKVPVTWEVYSTVEIEAETLEEAIEIIRKDEGDIVFPTETYDVDGSLRLSSNNIEILKIMMGL